MDLQIKAKPAKTVISFVRLTEEQNNKTLVLAKKNKVPKATVLNRLIEIGLEQAEK